MYKSLKDVYVSESLGRFVPPTYEPNVRLVLEGGAAGHMDHPFDLPQVTTGKDLIRAFEDAVKSIQTTPPAVKIDGVNASIKLVHNPDGSIEFGLDRGSNKALDVKGVTKKDLPARFSEGHGMIAIGGEVLDIFNKALPTIKDDLAKLGFFKKPLILNMEYVKGGTNVIGYADNFLAIHGINEIYEVKSPVRGSDSPAPFTEDGNKIYCGNASAKAKGKNLHVEGFELTIKPDSINLEQKLNEIKQALQSSISYAGGNDLRAFQGVKYVRINK